MSTVIPLVGAGTGVAFHFKGNLVNEGERALAHTHPPTPSEEQSIWPTDEAHQVCVFTHLMLFDTGLHPLNPANARVCW